MALPKFLIRVYRPCILIIILTMIYLAYDQLKSSEKKAYIQSRSNIHTASLLVSSHIEAATSKLYLLQGARNSASFDTLASKALSSTLLYSDILLVNPKSKQYESMRQVDPNVNILSTLVWRPIIGMSTAFSISPIYQTSDQRWVFSVRYQTNEHEALWIEFDLLYISNLLKGLRTLDEGYLFVVDKLTGKLIFHPDPERIGSDSISYQAGIKALIEQGQSYGTFEYYFKNQHKMSVYDANNLLNFVFISGTNRSDILSNSYQFTLTGVIIALILLFIVIVNYLIFQLNKSLSILNHKETIADFKHELRAIFDRFCHHSGVQFCLYKQETEQFTTIDFHGNEQVILTDKSLASQYSSNEFYYFGKSNTDALGRKLHINSRHYVMPLFNNSGLIAIIYIPMFMPTHSSLLKMIRNFSEVSLNNLLMNQKMLSKDVMTNLDNKMAIRNEIDGQLGNDNVYLALVDIDQFRSINDKFGHQSGDKIITHTAKLILNCFPKPMSISLARFGGEEYGLLFKANDENHAYDLCEMLRHRVETSGLPNGEETIQYTISIGITSVDESQNSSIGRADKALSQAKGFGRNQVVLNTF
ncbi:diguanylate cyclase [Vibrio sp. 10N.261.55.A7]|uniref:sensor domain-containing diguanylate cyclase n=1 Tax=Vibrio sp. 10N.261.55.A7 TaxID=1880851 RepID=UPI000C81DAA0|nr:diguanylate cyclase [Vibrio sp. 10N.261.55.A7]